MDISRTDACLHSVPSTNLCFLNVGLSRAQRESNWQTEAVPSPPPTNIQSAPPERGVKSQSTPLHWENNKYFHSTQLCANLKTPSRQQITVQCITWPVTPELNGRLKKKYPSWFLVFFTFKKRFMEKKRPFKSWDLNLSKKMLTY